MTMLLVFCEPGPHYESIFSNELCWSEPAAVPVALAKPGAQKAEPGIAWAHGTAHRAQSVTWQSLGLLLGPQSSLTIPCTPTAARRALHHDPLPVGPRTMTHCPSGPAP